MAKCKQFEDVSYCRGQIFKIKHGFGFIKHGMTREENIFFNLRALVTPPNTKYYNINRYLSIGEIVECIYGESKGEFAGKYSALRVWKLGGGLKNQDRITPLSNRVICGTAKIVYRIREIGVLDVRDDYSNDNYEDQDQNDTEFVYFNLKDICFPPEDVEHLSCNRYIHFVSSRAAEGSDSDFSWNAIRMWRTNNRVSQVEHNQSNLFYAKVEVESVNTVGAVLVHKGNKIALVWTELQLSETTLEFFEVEKGDLMWCLVGKASTTTTFKGGGGDQDNNTTKDSAYDTVHDQWIVRKILDTFTHETEEDHPLPKFYKNNYAVLPTRSSNELLEQQFLKEFRVHDEVDSNNLQLKGRKKFTYVNHQPQMGEFVRYQAETLDLIAAVANPQVIEQNGGSGAVKNAISSMGSSCYCVCHIQDNCRLGHDLVKPFDLANCDGAVASITPYGGRIEYTDEPSVTVEFGAHNFYCDGVPIAHTSFQIGTKVHFNARRVDNGYQAVQVWIGSPPLNK